MASETPARVAERLYYDSPSLEFSATVTDIRLVATERDESGTATQVWQVALDRTAFYPEGGGQPADTGVLVARARSGATLTVPVERVDEDAASEVWHVVRKPLVAGTEVTGHIDAGRRHDHMQQHTGQHLLSAVFLSELGARTVSFHLGADVATIDLVLGEGTETLTPEQAARVEDAANRLIFENRPLTPRWHSRAEAETMLLDGRLRKLPDRSGPMRVVEMAGVEYNACGGTHVPSTGSVGGLLVRRAEKVRAGWRVEFLCGLRAVRAARQEHTLLTSAASLLSVGPLDISDRVANLLSSARQTGKELQFYLGELGNAEANALDARLAPGAWVDMSYTDRQTGFAKPLAASLTARGRGAVFSVAQGGEGIVVLLRPPGATFDAGQVVKAFLRDNFPEGGARGGGTPTAAQIVVSEASAGTAASVRTRLAELVKGLSGPPTPLAN